ncbi:MAG: hypothetical protein KGI27_14075 [Thaumarchaeota archaeon]|nr:hypothetical protein [Nitrososphaerota archaeon]
MSIEWDPMKVKDLIKLLEKFPPDSYVMDKDGWPFDDVELVRIDEEETQARFIPCG